MLDKIRRWVRPIVGSHLFLIALGLVVFFFLYIYRIGSSTIGLSKAEAAASANSQSLSAIWRDPTYAPHKLLQLVFKHIFDTSPTSLRLASAIFAAVFLVCFYLLCARWFGRLIATVVAIFLAATPWVSLMGRSAEPSIMLLAPIVLLLAYYRLARSSPKYLTLTWLIFIAGVGGILYIPGLIWLALIGAIVNRRSLVFSLKRLKLNRLLLGGLVLAIVLSPLFLAFIRTPSLLHHWLLVPASWIGFGAFAKGLAWSLSSLFFRVRMHLDWLLGRQPVLTVMCSALAVFGAYAMSLQARQKLYVILALIGFGCLAAAINDNLIYLTYCLVPLLMLAAAGLRFLFLQWQSVFPKNPLPRYFAYALIISLAIGQLIYGIRTTVLAWPHAPETKQTFVLK